MSDINKDVEPSIKKTKNDMMKAERTVWLIMTHYELYI